MTLANSILMALAVTVANPLLHAQSAACNNLSRSAQITAGYHNSSNETCSQFTFSVAGQQFNTPPQCQQGYAYYHGTVYACGPSATGLHCKAQANKVYLTTATGGGCPSIVGLTPSTFTSWSNVPASIFAAMRCKLPTVDKTYDWSASTSNCGNGIVEPPPDLGQEQTNNDGQLFVRILGDPRPTFPSTTQNPFLSPYEIAQTGSSDTLHARLRTAFDLNARMLGAQVLASVSYEFRAADGSVESAHTTSISGKVWANGCFDVTQAEAVSSAGEGRTPVVTRLVFNGVALFEDINETEEANAYGFVGTRSATSFALLTRFVEPIYRWVSNPLEVALFEGSVYESNLNAAGTLDAVSRRIGSGVDSIVSDTHELEITTAGVRPKSWLVFDAAGGPRVRLSFADHRSLAPGLWRPFTTSHVDYLDGTASGRKLTTTLTVQRAVPLTSSALDPWPFAADRVWCVWK